MLTPGKCARLEDKIRGADVSDVDIDERQRARARPDDEISTDLRHVMGDEVLVVRDGLEAGQIDPSRLITHRFDLSEILQAYEGFGNAAEEGALKVLLTA